MARNDGRTPAPNVFGKPGTTYPHDDLAYPVIVEHRTVTQDTRLKPYFTPHDRVPAALLTSQTRTEGDNTDAVLVERYEVLPGPWLAFTRYDNDLGPIQGRRRAVRNTGQAALLSATNRTTYEAREMSEIVAWEIEESWDNPAFPINTGPLLHEPLRGDVASQTQLAVKTGAEEAGSITINAGVATKVRYEPFDEYHLKRIVETWDVPGPDVFTTTVLEDNIVELTRRRLVVSSGMTSGRSFAAGAETVTRKEDFEEPLAIEVTVTRAAPGTGIVSKAKNQYGDTVTTTRTYKALSAITETDAYNSGTHLWTVIKAEAVNATMGWEVKETITLGSNKQVVASTDKDWGCARYVQRYLAPAASELPVVGSAITYGQVCTLVEVFESDIHSVAVREITLVLLHLPAQKSITETGEFGPEVRLLTKQRRFALTGGFYQMEGSTALTGFSTAFTTELVPGDVIHVSNLEFIVASVADNSNLTTTLPSPLGYLSVGLATRRARLETGANIRSSVVRALPDGTDEIETVYLPQTSYYQYGYEVERNSGLGVYVWKRLVANSAATYGGVVTPDTTPILGASVAAQTVLTIADTSLLKRTGGKVTIAGNTTCTTSPPGGINGTHTAEILTATTLRIPIQVTAVTGGGAGGTVRLTAEIFREIQPGNHRYAIEINSQVDTASFTSAARTWDTEVPHSFEDTLTGITPYQDSGSSDSDPFGTFVPPYVVNYASGYNVSGEVGIEIQPGYRGPIKASIARTYSYGAPAHAETVLRVRPSVGEIVIAGGGQQESISLHVTSDGTEGGQLSTSSSRRYSAVRVGPVLTGSFGSGTIGVAGSFSSGSGTAHIAFNITPSTPTSFTAGDTFIKDVSVTPGLLGVFVKDVVTGTVPS